MCGKARYRVLALLIVAMVAFAPKPGLAAAWLTKGDDFSKAVTYGLNFAAETADKKSGAEAAKKILGTDLTWDLLGKNYELLGGDPGEISGFKNDIDRVTDVLKAVNEVSKNLGAGQNVDAAIASLDLVVSRFGNPVIKTLWASIKLTNESYKAVASTKAELQVEQLYSIVNRDRRLVGEMTGSGPPLIPLDADTVSYFYNRYLITDPQVRALVKTYVETSLGDTFPSLPTGTRFLSALTGTTDQLAEEHELRELQEFRNRSRGWIRSLLEDLNKQVTRQWAETRLRQAQAEFDEFMAVFGGIHANLNDAIDHFMLVSEIRRELGEYPARFEALREESSSLWQAYQALELRDARQKLDIRSRMLGIAGEANRLALRSGTVFEYDLRDRFLQLRETAVRFAGQIWDEVSPNLEVAVEASLVPEPVQPVSVAGRVLTTEIEEYEKRLGRLWEPYIEYCKRSIEAIESAPLERMQALLERNEHHEATRLHQTWWQGVSELRERDKQELDRLSHQIRHDRMPHMANSPLIAPVTAYLETQVAYWQGTANNENNRRNLTRARETLNNWRTALERHSTASANLTRQIGTTQRELIQEFQLRGRVNARATGACRTLEQAADFWQENASARALLDFYSSRRNAVNAEASHFINELIRINEAIAGGLALQGRIERAERFLSQNSYTMLRVFDSGSDFGSLENIRFAAIEPMGNISTGMQSHRNSLAELERMGLGTQASVAKRELDELVIPLDLVEAYTGFGLTFQSRSGVLGNLPRRDLGSLYDAVKERASSLESNLDARARQLQARLEQESFNRSQDGWYLNSIREQWQAWVDEQVRAQNLRGAGGSGPSERLVLFEFEPHVDRRIDGMGRAVVTVSSNRAVIQMPGHHLVRRFATASDFGSSSRAAAARQTLDGLPVSRFMRDQMPKTWAWVDDQLNLRHFQAESQGNVIYRGRVVWESDVAKAESLANRLVPVSNDFDVLLKEIGDLLPGTLRDDGQFNRSFDERRELEDFALGKRINLLRERIDALILERRSLIRDARMLEQEIETARSLMQLFRQELRDLEARFAALRTGSDTSAFDELNTSAYSLNGRFHREQILTRHIPENEHRSLSDAIRALIDAVQARLRELAEKDHISQEQIQQLYQDFITAYGRGDLRGLLRLLAPDWQGGDGSDLRDVEEVLTNSFRVFDRIQYRISGFSATQLGDGRARVSYSVRIVGENRRQRLTHEEQSQVVEEIGLVDGQPRILRTLSGTQWLR